MHAMSLVHNDSNLVAIDGFCQAASQEDPALFMPATILNCTNA
jgi:hypothetical protein